jgi:hypothetical protein
MARAARVIKFIKIYSYITARVVQRMDVIVRGLDEKLHRKFKAEAALKGISLSKALEEAMRTWLRSESNMVAVDENEANNLAYESMKDQLNSQYRGKYAVFCGGKFLGATDTLEEAGALARRSSTSPRKALVAKIGEKRPAGGEWLWSSLELQTA